MHTDHNVQFSYMSLLFGNIRSLQTETLACFKQGQNASVQ
jgi:hypothetical protein